MRRNKYNNKKVVVDGFKFDSAVESKYYLYLKSQKKIGIIKDFQLQKVFELQPSYRIGDNRKQRAIKYVADFVVTKNDGSHVVIDVKGGKAAMTDVFKLKRKLFEFKYQQPLVTLILRRGAWIEI